jgi:hypothetical protein
MKRTRLFRMGWLGAIAASGLLAAFAASASASSGGTVDIESLSQYAGSEQVVDVTVADVPPPGLGAWTIDITYDASLLSAVECEPEWGGLCNINYEPNTIRLAGVRVFGIVGDDVLGSITFRCADVGQSAITLAAPIFADSTPGAPQPMSVKIGSGAATCSEQPEEQLPEGDADCDGDVDAIDGTLVLQHTAGLLADLPCENDVDMNDDGAVTSVDATIILQIAAGLLD